MLRKVRRDARGARLRLPRRGRIRAMGIIVLLAVAGSLYLRRPDAGRTSPADRAKPDETEAASRAAEQSPELAKAATAVRKGTTLVPADVRALMRRYPPRLTQTADTIHVRGSSLAIHYSIDTALQALARTMLRRYHPKYGAVVALDPETGRTLVLAAYNHPEEPPLARDLYCRSMFPAASIVKIVTAASAAENAGLTAGSPLETAGANHTLYRFQLKKELPRHRAVTLEEAFAYSINPVFGRLGIHYLGAETMRASLTQFGFGTPVPFDLHVDEARAAPADSSFELAELACGFNQNTRISPLFGALLAAAVSAGGYMPTPAVVDSIRDLRSGHKRYAFKARPWRIPMRPQTAAELAKLMRAVARYGTARKSFVYVKRSGRFTGIEYGGKTGNVDMDGTGRVDWFAGFARHASDPGQRIAACVVTVHGPQWTVHSSFLGAELMRAYIRNVQIARERLAADTTSRAATAAHPDKES
ncbi:MAG: hypothetical protein GF418_16615 [Chitinivibrionales bacterium]|nr:hypothetical protein [Chitinivibrionales bacterium]